MSSSGLSGPEPAGEPSGALTEPEDVSPAAQLTLQQEPSGTLNHPEREGVSPHPPPWPDLGALSLLLPSGRGLLLLLSFFLRSLLLWRRWLLRLCFHEGSWLLLSRWRLLYFLFPPGFSPRSPGGAEGGAKGGAGLCSDVCGGERGGEEDQDIREGEEREEARGDAREQLYSQLESGGLDSPLDWEGEEEREGWCIRSG